MIVLLTAEQMQKCLGIAKYAAIKVQYCRSSNLKSNDRFWWDYWDFEPELSSQVRRDAASQRAISRGSSQCDGNDDCCKWITSGSPMSDMCHSWLIDFDRKFSIADCHTEYCNRNVSWISKRKIYLIPVTVRKSVHQTSTISPRSKNLRVDGIFRL